MNHAPTSPEYTVLLQRALHTIRELRSRVAKLESSATEPVAVVGVACRLPGDCASPEALWHLLQTAGSGIADWPASRLPALPSEQRRRGGFLRDLEQFDPGLFGISPREAASMDPQQRLLLEVSWEAMEDAAQPFQKLEGSRTGVFVGVTNYDYCQRMIQEVAPSELDAYCLTSNASTFAAGRLSHLLGLQGPSLSVDTACSSSLVALHLACQSLRAGECELAFAGGVNALLSPEWFAVLAKAGMLAPDGYCKTFDQRANGYVRSEGCVVFVLKRLSAARASRDHIYAILRGSSINHDGRSAGVTVPSGAAQQSLIRSALQAAGVLPEQVSYVETHGTGTPLGDPIEVRALSAAMCAGRSRSAPLRIGSLKANIGHLEPAAGAAGLLKVVLALNHEEIPPQVQVQEINQEIDLKTLDLAIGTQCSPWPRGATPRIAAVSSFGASGTNAHMVVEEAPPAAPRTLVTPRLVELFTLSARSDAALTALAQRYEQHLLAHPEVDLGDLCFTANSGRAQFLHRLALPAASGEELRQSLAAVAAHQLPPGATAFRPTPGGRPKVAFLFTGQGCQYPAMALELLAEPVFQRALQRCAEILVPYLEVPLLELLAAPDGRLDETRYTQPALFAVEYALARLWQSWGVQPDAVLGHSVGEYVAACVADAVELEAVLPLVALRGRMMQEGTSDGAMAVVFAGRARIEPFVVARASTLAIAAVNGPDNVVLSGHAAAVEEVLLALSQAGIKYRRINVTKAFHSPLLDPILDRFEQAAEQLHYAEPRIPLISNLTALPVTSLSGSYFRQHTRAPVRFWESMDWLLAQGFDTFIEIGPAPNLVGMARRFAERPGLQFLPSLRKDQPQLRTLLTSLGSLWSHGAAVDWESFGAGFERQRLSLPTYPFERKRCWYTASVPTGRTAGPSGSASLLGQRIDSPSTEVHFQAIYDPAVHPCLADCRVADMQVVNVGVYLDAAFQGWRALRGQSAVGCQVAGLAIHRGFLLAGMARREVQVRLGLQSDAEPRFALYSQSVDAAGKPQWLLHADARLTPADLPPRQLPVAELTARCPDLIAGPAFYAQLALRQLHLGPAARWIEQINYREGEALTRMRPPQSGEADSYCVHPGLVDAVFQSLFACLPASVPQDAIYMIVELAQLSLLKLPLGAAICHARLRSVGPNCETLVADIDVADEQGSVVLRIVGALLKRTTPQDLSRITHAVTRNTADTPEHAPPAASSGPTRAAILQAPPSARRALILDLVLNQLAVVLRAAVTELDPEESLTRAGFDSLMAIELKDALASKLGLVLPLASLLGGASPTALADELNELASCTPPAADRSLPPVAEPAAQPEEAPSPEPAQPYLAPDRPGRHEAFALTDLQQAYLLGRLPAFECGGISTYFYLEVDVREVELQRLEQSLAHLIERHDMLRAVITPDGQQRVLPTVPPFMIRCTDLRGQTEAAVLATLAEIRQEMANQTFPTDRFPLFDIRATQLDGALTRLHLGFDGLIIDAWSTALLFREWVQVYHSGPAALPPLELTFRDYVLGAQQLEQQPAYAKAEAYWHARLASLPPPPDLPLMKSPAALGRPRFAHRSLRLPAHEWGKFKENAREAGCTASAALCAAYSKVLSMWSKSASFTLNVLFFNRRPLHPQVDRVIGNFSATTLLQVSDQADEDLLTRAGRLQQQLWRDLDHADFSGVRVVRELTKLDGDPRRARMPVVFASTISFASREGSGAPTGLAQHLLGLGSGGNEVHSCIRTPQVFLDHQIVEDADGLVLNWDVVEELFPPGMIDQMLQRYGQLVSQLAASASAWRQRLQSLVATVPAQPTELRDLPEALLHEPFVRIAAAQPERPALLSGRRCLSYGELDLESNQVAHWLRAQGALPNQLVAIEMEKGVEQLIAALGILKAGAAYVPIDARLPAERRHYLLQHTGARQVLTQSWLPPRAASGCAALQVDKLHCCELENTPLVPSSVASDLAYVIYTSGSTGLPKGVMIEHRAALNTVLDINARCAVDETSRVLALSSMSFDLSVYDLFGILAAGGAIVLPGPEAAREPAQWYTLIHTYAVTLWNTVPALMEMFVDYLSTQQAALAGLRTVLLSGDWIPVGLPDRIRALAPQAALYSLGGATEAAIWSCVYPINQVDPKWSSIPYGKGLQNQQLLILSENQELCPLWVTGEIYIGGAGVARGYWQDADKTRASFIQHPVSGERLYRTGDLGRLLPSGDVEFLGRQDFQVKVQGYRIELGELEVALSKQRGVRAAAAVAVGPRHGSKRLIAYVVTEGQDSPSPTELRQALFAQLPEHMVPQHIVALDALPLSANGKLDRAALAALQGTEQPTPSTTLAPRTELERVVQKLWSEVLPGPIGIQQSFFEVGGNSLLAVRLLARIRQSLGRELPLATVFESPTIEQLALRLQAIEPPVGKELPVLIPIQPHGERPPLFFVHPVSGSVLCYAKLARKLGADQPFYGLQAPAEQESYSIEALALRYLQAIRQVQPRGPYHLGGWSMGGVVAYEMARQLHLAAEKVAFLGLVDVTEVPGTNCQRLVLDDAALLSRFASDLGALGGQPVNICPEELRQLTAEESVQWVAGQLRASGVLHSDIDLVTVNGLLKTFTHNMRALVDYRPSPYGGHLWFLRGTQAGGAEQKSAEQWLGLAGSGELHELDANHYSLLTDGGDELAKLLRQKLQPSP